jgi:2-hydroxychromene-2-carboxylate isomerase
MIVDFTRFARRHGVPLVLNPHSPIHTPTLMRGVFGAPTMFVGDAMFRGQDRLGWVAEALR